MVVTAQGVAPSPHIIVFDILHVALHVCMRPASVHALPLSRMLTCCFSVPDIGENIEAVFPVQRPSTYHLRPSPAR